MAMKPFCYWSFSLTADGSSTSLAVNLLTDPFGLSQTSPPGSVATIGNPFALSISNLPTGITIIATSSGTAPASVSLGMVGAVTFTWSSAPTNGETIQMYGKLEF